MVQKLNFIHLAKEIVDSLKNAAGKSFGKELTWVAIIKLEEINEDTATCPLYFLDEHKDLVKDEYAYTISMFTKELYTAKREGLQYAFLPVMQQKTNAGRDIVIALKRPETRSFFLFSQKTLWHLLPADVLMDFFPYEESPKLTEKIFEKLKI